MKKTTRTLFHLSLVSCLGVASVVSGQVLTPSVEDASLTWPSGTGFGGYVSTTDDALGPFFAETVHFRGRSTGGVLQVYRYRLEFDKPVVLQSVVVEGAAWAGGASLRTDVIRLFDADNNVISEVDALAGSDQFQSVEIPGDGFIGQTFFLEEINGDDVWRYRSNIVVNFDPAIATVSIDVSPQGNRRCVNQNGTVIFGEPNFDVASINVDTLAFGEQNTDGHVPLCSVDYVNDDEHPDLVCKFVPGTGKATLTGQMLDGSPFEGSDTICAAQ